MSKFVRHNIIRAVRVLPEAVRIGASANDGKVSREALAQDETAAVCSLDKDQSELLQKELANLQNYASQLEEELKEALQRNRVLENDFLAHKKQVDEEYQRAVCNLNKEKDSLFLQAKKEGYDAGQIEGHSEGLKSARDEVEQEYSERFSGLLATFDNIHAKKKKKKSSLAELNLPYMMRLWKCLLERLLKKEVSIDQNTVIRILESILTRVSDKEKIVIYLNPEDVERVKNQKSTYADLLRGVKVLDIHVDDHVGKGSCIVETNLGVYDARWKTQFEQIEKEIDQLFLEEASALELRKE